MAVVKVNGVCGGRACLERTRLPIWVLVLMRRQGATVGEILRSYPGLVLPDLVAAFAYGAAHPVEMQKDIEDQCA